MIPDDDIDVCEATLRDAVASVATLEPDTIHAVITTHMDALQAVYQVTQPAQRFDMWAERYVATLWALVAA